MKARLAAILLLPLLLSSCGPSYPKERVAESLVELCKREYGIDVQAQLVKTTLGVLVVIPGLVDELMKQAASSPQDPPVPILVEGQYQQKVFHFQFVSRGVFTRTDPDKPEPERKGPDREASKPLKTLDQVSTAMRRVALSTDAKLEFYTMIARDPGPASLDLVFAGHLDDLKRVQFLDISLGELQKRSRVIIRPHPEAMAKQTVSQFLQELTEQPLPQLLSRYSAPNRRFRELFPKILDLAVDLQGQQQMLIDTGWPVLQIGEEEVLVYVPLEPIGREGALLFLTSIREGQSSLLDIVKLPDGQLPADYQKFGPPETWGSSFYVKGIDMADFLSEQIAKRVLMEFEPMAEPEPEQQGKRAKKQKEPAGSDEITKALLETSAYVLHSYRFNDFDQLTVTDAMSGTRWAVSSKDLETYRRRNAPSLKPLP